MVVDVVIEARGFMRLMEPMMGSTLRKTAERYEQDLRAAWRRRNRIGSVGSSDKEVQRVLVV